MTQEDKELLLKDLSSRLLYGVMCDRLGHSLKLVGVHPNKEFALEFDRGEYMPTEYTVDDVKPYLRPMSSMTEEEKDNLQSLHDIISNENYGDGYSPSAWNAITEWEDYCNARHLDYRGLIPMGLALESLPGMYNLA